MRGSTVERGGSPAAADRDQVQGFLGVSAASAIWGSTALFARWSWAQPLTVVFWRVALASAALLAYVLMRRELGLLLRVGRRRLLGLLLLGLLLVLGWGALFTAYTCTTVATAILLNYVGPVLVAAFAPLVTHVPSDRRIILPLALALAGMAIIVGPQALTATGSRNLLGILLSLGSAVTYAASVLITKRLLAGVPAGLLALTQQAVATVVLLPVLFLLPTPVGVGGWGSLAVLGVVHSGVAWLLFFRGLRTLRADRVAVLTYIEPVAAVVFAALFLAEPASWFTVLGGAAVIAGGIMVARLGPVPGPGGSGLPALAAGQTNGGEEMSIEAADHD
jgi:drug/metabolite transporter (DMT)-like permease